MADSSIASAFVPTVRETLEHWQLLEAELGHSVTLAGSFGRSELAALHEQLQQKITAVQPAENALSVQIGQKDALRSALYERIGQFLNLLKARFPDSPHFRTAPKRPAKTATETVFLKALDDCVALWSQLEGAATVTLPGGYTQSVLVQDTARLRTAFAAVTHHKTLLTDTRKHRDSDLPTLRTRLNQYKALVKASLPAGHHLIGTVPIWK